MEDVIYLIRIGMHDLMATDQEHAIELVRLLAKAQPVNCKYDTDTSTDRIKLVDRLGISLEVKPAGVVESES